MQEEEEDEEENPFFRVGKLALGCSSFFPALPGHPKSRKPEGPEETCKYCC
jgi:hypothetical protein